MISLQDDLKQNKETYMMSIFKTIRGTEHWFTKILDAIDIAVLVADEEAVVCYVNPAHTRIIGIKPEEILGKYLIDVRSGALLPGVIQSGKGKMGAYRREGGTEYIVDLAPVIIEGKIVGGVSLGRDITEFNRIAGELQKYVRKTKHLTKIVSRAFEAKYSFQDIIGNSQEMQITLKLAKKAAMGHSNIVITGESGTGKEMFAQAIHNASHRSEGHFVAVNCAAIAASLVESELFGYEEGAFTGAQKGGKIGLFEIANGGTIFLDEIGELGLDIQAKLLRVLQERTVRKIGASNENSLDVRIIAATNKDFDKIVSEGKFREDLYYRLNVINVHLPPLRKRGGDILLLAQAFLLDYSQKYGHSKYFDNITTSVLLQHNWPGNIRELRNVVEYVINVCEEEVIKPSHLPIWLQPAARRQGFGTLAEKMQEFEKQTLLFYLNKHGYSVNDKKQIAKELGISLATLYNRLKALGLTF